MPTYIGTQNADVIDLSRSTNGPHADFPEHQQYWQIDGLGGNDSIYGTRWADGIDGGEGDDLIFGNDGRDAIYGRNGNDRLSGGNHQDFIDGGAGNDQIWGDAGDDWLKGGTGADTLSGGDGDDALFGEDGNDRLFGDAGDDFLVGGEGADILDGGAGDDRLWGGPGNDTYQYNGQGKDTINDAVNQAGNPHGGVNGTADVLRVIYASTEIEVFDTSNGGLLITSSADVSDGIIDNYILIENFHNNQASVVEYLVTGDGWTYDLRQFLSPTSQAYSSDVLTDYGF